MTVRRYLTTLLARRRRLVSAERRARDAFIAIYPDRHIGWIVRPKLFGDFSIVTICWGKTRPPMRSWWRVPLDEAVPSQELSYSEAAAIIEIPSWR